MCQVVAVELGEDVMVRMGADMEDWGLRAIAILPRFSGFRVCYG